MNSITARLPAELIILICQHLAAESSASLLQLCLTSKGFYEIAYPIIYNDVRVKSHYGPKSALLCFSSRVHRYHRNVQSLDIRFTKGHMSALLTGAPSAFSNLDPTTALLPNLTNLKTFIVQLEHHEKRNTRLPDGVISGLLRKLPKSVRNLEVVTDGLDKITYDERRRVLSNCYCEDIAGLLPQLQHLRMRKGYFCANAFKTLKVATEQKLEGQNIQPWLLQSITIRLDMEPEWVGEPVSASYCTIRGAATSASVIAAPLRKAVEAGLLPDLKQAIIVSRFGRSNNLCTAKKTEHSGFAIHDVIQNCHTLIPVLAVETDMRIHVGTGHEAMSKWDDLFLVRDVEGLDRFASFPVLSRLLEGNRTFRQMINMSNSPVFELALSDLDGREDVSLPQDVRMSLWIRESQTGRCLLTAKRLQGLGILPEVLSEYLPTGWSYGRNNKKGERQIVRA